MDRKQLPLIANDPQGKMVFLTGPRQVGKTHLALALLKQTPNGVYLNYDNLEDRAIITRAAWLPTTEFLVLDEPHKLAALHYLRTKEKKEVDFAVAVEDRPTTIIEVKLTESEPTASLRYFHEKYGLPAVQVVRHLRQERMAGAIAIRRALGFPRELEL
ncbi:MAG: hypothetical protein A2521_16320 [Deltaproteobacteria bacterium RIFOXYD12_FULL_57_12]|nr:MAG: hypothetical protein A2521_16320 [Deltaproteobacteria bacterium RIFOXYD12_FULL_57_12]